MSVELGTNKDTIVRHTTHGAKRAIGVDLSSAQLWTILQMGTIDQLATFVEFLFSIFALQATIIGLGVIDTRF